MIWCLGVSRKQALDALVFRVRLIFLNHWEPFSTMDQKKICLRIGVAKRNKSPLLTSLARLIKNWGVAFKLYSLRKPKVALLWWLPLHNPKNEGGLYDTMIQGTERPNDEEWYVSSLVQKRTVRFFSFLLFQFIKIPSGND